MSGEYYTVSGSPGRSAALASAAIRAEFASIAAGFDKLPTLTGNAGYLVRVNASETALETVATVPVSAGGSGGTSFTANAFVVGQGTLGLLSLPALTNGEMFVGVTSGLPAAQSGATLRASLGLTIGTHVQAYAAGLTAIAALTPTDGNIIVGDGAAWVAESGATARESLGLTIGTHVQAYAAALTALSDIPSITAMTIAEIAATDGIVVDDGGTLKRVSVQSMGSRVQAATTQTLALDDGNSEIVNTGASDYTVTVPPNSSVAFPIGVEMAFLCQSTGTITLAEGSGVTIVSLDSNKVVSASGGGAYLVKTATDVWHLVGSLEA